MPGITFESGFYRWSVAFFPESGYVESEVNDMNKERRRGWSRLIGVLVLLAVTGLVVLYAVSFRSVREDGGNILKLKETVEGVNYLYMEEPGRKDHLLKLRCGDGVDFDTIQLTNEWGEENSFRMSFRWNRWTRRGAVTECEPDGVHLGGLMDVTFEADCVPLFGYPEVFFTTENYYPDLYSEPRGKGFRTRWWPAPAGMRSPTPSMTWWMESRCPSGRIRCPRRSGTSWCASGSSDIMNQVQQRCQKSK